MAVAVSCAPALGHTTAMSSADSMLRDRLPQLWRSIESAHYTYLETDDSPEKLSQRKKLEGYIMEYLSLVPHECKFGLSETGRVFSRTVAELPEFSAYRAGLGWAALARYAANLLAQPWRKEYRTIRVYCGYYKHEVESNLVSAEVLLEVMGYKSDGTGRVSLDGPVCPDLVAAVSRDALIAYVECQMMCEIWERAWRGRGGVSWSQVVRERARRAGDVAATVARLTRNDYSQGTEIYSNVSNVKPNNHSEQYRSPSPPRHAACSHQLPLSPPNPSVDEPRFPLVQPSYVTVAPNHIPHNMIYTVGPQDVPRYAVDVSTQCANPMVNPYGVVPGFYYAPVQAPYVIPAQMYAPIKQAATVPVNGYPVLHRYPSVPTAQLIELEPSTGYTSSDVPDGKHHHDKAYVKSHKEDVQYRDEGRSHRDDKRYEDKEKRKSQEQKKLSHSKSSSHDITLPRSDTQPALSAAREDGTGTYESWDYVFRNLSNHDYDRDRYRRSSPPLERDSRTLERLDKDDRRRFQPTTMDLEDGMLALNIDRSYDEEIYRAAKVNEHLQRLKQEAEAKKAKALAKKQLGEEREKKTRKPAEPPLVDIEAMNPKIIPDKIRLISKKDAKDRKDIQKQTLNGRVEVKEVKTVKKVVKSTSSEADKPIRPKPVENGVQSEMHGHRAPSVASTSQHNQHNGSRELNTQLIVTLDETDSHRAPTVNATVNPVKAVNGEAGRWECTTCTYVNRPSFHVCEMCGKSRRKGPEVAPLTSGGRECPACTLVNKRDAIVCDACGTSLDHSPTYI